MIKKIILLLFLSLFLASCTQTPITVAEVDNVSLNNGVGVVNQQNPYPVDQGGWFYYSDIDTRYSELNGFVSTNSSLNGFQALTTDLFEGVIDNSSNTVKNITVYFKRTMSIANVGFGCEVPGKNFSNIKIILIGSGGATRDAIDNSDDDLKRTTRVLEFEQGFANGVIIQFHTADEVCLTNLNFQKIQLFEQTPFLAGLDIARGNIEDVYAVHKFGNNPDIDAAATFEDLWNGGGDYTGFNAVAAETLEVFSTSANDIAGGTGAHNITVRGLDANYLRIEETVEMNGTNSAFTTQEFIRMDRALVPGVGSSGYNEGEITVRQSTTTANVMAVMPATYAQTMIVASTVPANETAYINDWFSSLSGKVNSQCIVRVMIREFGEGFKVKEQMSINGQGTTYVQRNYQIPKNDLHQKADIKIQASCDTNNVGVAGGFDLVLESDN